MVVPTQTLHLTGPTGDAIQRSMKYPCQLRPFLINDTATALCEAAASITSPRLRQGLSSSKLHRESQYAKILAKWPKLTADWLVSLFAKTSPRPFFVEVTSRVTLCKSLVEVTEADRWFASQFISHVTGSSANDYCEAPLPADNGKRKLPTRIKNEITHKDKKSEVFIAQLWAGLA